MMLSFLKSFFKGAAIIIRASVFCLVVLQLVYVLGFYLSKNKARLNDRFFSSLLTFPDLQSAWLFASDAQPILLPVGLLVLIMALLVVMAFVAVVVAIAEIGGWKGGDRIRKMLD